MREDKPEILIDDVIVRYGQLSGGLYFRHEHAYDWSDNLIDVARRVIDYRRRAERIRRERESDQGGK